jgi:phosphatidylserine decarboxylase
MIPDVSPDLPGRGWRFSLALLGRLPQAAMSRGLGHLADLHIPASLRKPILGRIARILGIDLDEAARPLETHASLNELFVRELKPGARVWPRDPKTVASPVDGILGQLGAIENGALIQAKGRRYRAADLLDGDDRHAAERYRNGTFITIYLSPRHYHRIHSPCVGEITAAWHVPGALLPVNEPAVMHVENLFPRNERLVCAMRTALGEVAVVAVGAYNVGRISAAFDPRWSGSGGRAWVTNRPGGATAEAKRYTPPIPIEQGAQIMAFHLGSTVVLLVEHGVSIAAGMIPGREVRMGDVIARAP